MSSALWAEVAVLTVYADGCDKPNTLTCYSGTEVALTSKAEGFGIRFARWSDGVTDNPRTITVNNNITLTAVYETIPAYVLTVYAQDCKTPNTLTCFDGTQVSLTAEDEVNSSSFLRWSDGNTDNPRSLTITRNITLTAVYTDEETDIRTIEQPSVATKTIRNGQFLIQHEGKSYNAVGVEVK